MGSVLPDPVPRFGTYQDETFAITGDFHQAYLWLKERFEPKVQSQSGPVKPLSRQERLADQNPGLVETLNDLPPSSYE